MIGKIKRKLHNYKVIRKYNKNSRNLERRIRAEDRIRGYWEDIAFEKGLKCGNCVNYYCDEYDGDHCENDGDMMARKCKEFVSWRDILRLNFVFFKEAKE